MKPKFLHAVSTMTMAALVIGQTSGMVSPAAAYAQDQSIATVSVPVVQQAGGEADIAAAQSVAEAPPPPPVDETPAERKARLKAEAKAQKQAEKEEKKRLAAEEKARKRAEKQKKGGNGTAKAVLACAAGAGAGLVLGRIFGAKKTDLLGAAVAGCGAGLAFRALTKKDNEELNSYVQDDFLVNEGDCNSTWVAPESQTNVALSCGETTYQTAQHSFYLEDDVAFDETNFQAAEVAKYSTTSLRLRSSPTTSEGDNIIGGFAAGDKLLTYGTTSDGKWTYVVDSLPDGQYELLGYAASAYLSDTPPAPAARAKKYAKLQPVAKKPDRAAVKRASATSDAGVRPARQVTASANTRCKSVNVTVGQETQNQSSCGGARLALMMPVKGEERNV